MHRREVLFLNGKEVPFHLPRIAGRTAEAKVRSSRNNLQDRSVPALTAEPQGTPSLRYADSTSVADRSVLHVALLLCTCTTVLCLVCVRKLSSYARLVTAHRLMTATSKPL